MSNKRQQRAHEFPTWLKWAYLCFVLVLVPVYAVEHGLRNFLWFSNVALLLGLVGVWTENRLVISTQAVSVSLLEIGWLVDFFGALVRGGESIYGLTAYMFDAALPLYLRLLSLYHVVLPFLLLWLLWRGGYDRRALRVWLPVGWGILLLAYAGPGERNVNWIYGVPGENTFGLPPLVWLAVVMCVCAVVWSLTHLLLKQAMQFFGRPVYPRDSTIQ